KDVLKVGGFSTDQLESARARQLLRQEIDLGSSSLEVIFTSQEWTARDPRFIAETEQALAGLEGLPEVKRVVPHTVSQSQISPDGHTAYAVVVLNVQPEVSQRLMPELERRIRPPETLTMYLSGAPAFYADIERLTEEDLRRAELISFPFAVVALTIVFGSVVAAGLPILVGGVAVAATLAIIFLVGQALDLSIFVTNVVTMLGLGLGMDYSLLMTNRFREELRTHPVDEALARTVATAGKAVVFSGLTVCVGLAGLFLFDFMMLRSIGFGGAVVVFLSVLAAVTLLPAAMGILGPRVSALRVRPLIGEDRPGLWARLATWVMRHPILTLIPVLGLLLLLGSPFLHVRLSAPDARILPASVPSRQGLDLLDRAFGESDLAPILIAVRATDPVLAPASLDALFDFTRRIEADPRVERVFSVVNLDPRISRDQYKLLYAHPEAIPDVYARSTVRAIAGHHVTMVSVVPRASPLSDEAKDLVRDLRQVDPGPWLTFLVDGGTAELMDVVDRLYSDFPKALGLIMLTTYLILLVLFRSVFLPIKAILMNSLSILASYGALVFVFQDG
ncbi:MAG TPA: MMPL family transporter, partial [Dehalococcoidia bacterium]|nr:MMPL family transporter [Dehalococcoidia bacterium]